MSGSNDSHLGYGILYLSQVHATRGDIVFAIRFLINTFCVCDCMYGLEQTRACDEHVRIVSGGKTVFISTNKKKKRNRYSIYI